MPRQIQSIERAAAILRLLSGRTLRRGVAELAEELRLAKSTVHGILRTLQAVGFVEQRADSGKYQLGAALLHLGSTYLDGNELRARALNWADALAIRTDETVRIGMLHGPRVLIVHHVFRPDDTRQTLDVGSLVPVHATALGKVLLAGHQYLLDELGSEQLDSYTPATVTDVTRLHEELRLIAERGWSSEIGELATGTASVAAPIEDRGHLIQGAIGISGPTRRLCTNGGVRAELANYVAESARAISRELGAIPW